MSIPSPPTEGDGTPTQPPVQPPVAPPPPVSPVYDQQLNQPYGPSVPPPPPSSKKKKTGLIIGIVAAAVVVLIVIVVAASALSKQATTPSPSAPQAKPGQAACEQLRVVGQMITSGATSAEVGSASKGVYLAAGLAPESIRNAAQRLASTETSDPLTWSVAFNGVSEACKSAGFLE